MNFTKDQLDELLRNNPALLAANPELNPSSNPELSRAVRVSPIIPVGDTRPVAVVERRPSNGPLAKGQDEKRTPKRVLVRVTTIRIKLADEDGLCEKFHVDCCRYAGLILGDESTKAKIEVRQFKASKGEEEKIIVEVFQSK